MIRVGIVGFGFMGRMHCRCWRQLQGVEVAAICDANPNVVEDTDKATRNIEASAGDVDLSGVQICRDFDRMLGEEGLDAISLTLPTYLHAEFSIKALEAGVNVLCEKPMALNVTDCQRMIEAAKSSGKVLMIGHCIRFWPEYAKAKEIVDSGKYGKVVAATFQRLGSPPNWAADNWFADEQRSGGMALDLHIHDTDFVQYLLGVPRAVRSFGTHNSAGQLVYVVTHYLYGDEKVVTAEGSWAMMPAFGFEMSFNIVLEKATVVYDLTRQPKFRVCPSDGEAFSPQEKKGDGYSLEIGHFAGQLKGQKTETVTTLEQSRDSVRIVQAEKESVGKGGPVRLV
jgi:predicted dehydrogenase